MFCVGRPLKSNVGRSLRNKRIELGWLEADDHALENAAASVTREHRRQPTDDPRFLDVHPIGQSLPDAFGELRVERHGANHGVSLNT